MQHGEGLLMLMTSANHCYLQSKILFSSQHEAELEIKVKYATIVQQFVCPIAVRGFIHLWDYRHHQQDQHSSSSLIALKMVKKHLNIQYIL